MGHCWKDKAFLLPLVIVIVGFIDSKSFANAQNETGETLFLTPLIKAGRLEEARNLSLVADFYPNITSYSGLITVNEDFGSNMYFWFFPASNNSSEAPVILWNDGGPGISAMFSVFSQNGPFKADSSNINFTVNDYSWHFTQNMIYIDNPVGVGFSFTSQDAGNINSGDSAAPNMHEFLVQFFQMFPDLQNNDFYNAGVSYGATYATHLANYIHSKNQENPEFRINLKGLILESPWLDPYHQIEYGDYLYNIGLIDEFTLEDFNNDRDSLRELMDQEKYSEAFEAWNTHAFANVSKVTGFPALNNILKDSLSLFNGTVVIDQIPIRKALHVGNIQYNYFSTDVQSRMHPNFMRSAKSSLEAILKGEYRTIIYVGNLDGLTGNLGVQNMLKNLDWEGAEELRNSTRTIWRVDQAIAGYAKTARNATLVLVRNAGHGIAPDQPAWGLDLVNRFTKGLPF